MFALVMGNLTKPRASLVVLMTRLGTTIHIESRSRTVLGSKL